MTEAQSIFGEDASQLDMLVQLLDAFPGQNEHVIVPIPPKARLPWAKALLKRGVRVHPELMEELPAPNDRPDAGSWMTPHTWVSREEYEKQTRPTPEQQQEQMSAMLTALDPQMAERIAAMSDAEKRAEMAEQATKIPAVIEGLAQLREQFKQGEP